ncbi:NAD(P)/FAD-dependent oxidoreductase [Halofilum ochraceum]|uniref:NAD(P)/FAD-dependent oxidoreductase n=1 Tax=Halofilum ochraceum TaxID=1611323 RepID=UPI0008DAED3C|nr:FAD-binding oxidoreductase [Halofilum ochraceum]
MNGTADILIVGAGMAGASAGYFLAHDGLRVLLLEREAQPGYHSTGRSAALFSETYGPASVRRLSTASRPFLVEPPKGFADRPLLTPRGLLVLGSDAEAGRIDALAAEGQANGAAIERLDGGELPARVPILRPGIFSSGLLEPDAMDMDVAALHQGFLRGLRHAGGAVVNNAEAERIERTADGWRITTRHGAVYEAPLLVDAAGAWADVTAEQAGVAPLGLVPKRRTGVMIDLPAGTEPGGWPLTADLGETFYFKPDAGRLMLSPADATPTAPQDAQPEIEDVATVIERFMEVTTVEVERPGETWAGLRSFVADGEPVAGYAPDAAGFFWLAGQGGYGIQTAVGMGRAACALLQRQPLPADMTALGLAADQLAPDRPGLKKP